MKRNPVLLTPLVILAFLLTQCAQEVQEKSIPITTDSETALELYREALVAANKVYVAKAMKLFEEALNEDPSFFQAAFRLAIFNFYFEETDGFKKYANKAVNMEADLSKGEQLMKSMLVALLDDPEADVSDIGKKIIDLYPEDDQAYFPLSFYYMIQNDDEHLIEIHETVLEITENPAPIYNLLGYSYMDLGRMEDAEDAFDMYIELEPDIPNPYDSKGDYYMKAENYEKAYEYYMKANEIDTLWSYKKAMKAQKMLEEAENESQ